MTFKETDVQLLIQILLPLKSWASVPQDQALGRRQALRVKDDEALEAFQYCCKLEGIIQALEPSHALAVLKKIAPKMEREKIVVMNMCGRGDKDIYSISNYLGVKL